MVVGDFVQIQARIVLALAGQTDFLAKLAAGADPYCLTAEGIFNRPPGSLHKDRTEDKPLRQVGKNTFLGCGFQMGGKKFHEKYCPDQPFEFATNAIAAYRKKVAPKVPKLWYSLEEAALKAVFDRQHQEVYGLRYELEDGWLTVRLLDGKKVWYWNPRFVEAGTLSPTQWRLPEEMRKPARKDAWAFQTVKGGRLVWIDAYGGLLTENVVMGLERQLLVRSMATCEKENLPVILNLYDEIVCEAEERHASWPALKQIMEDTPAWATALKLPIAAEGWTGTRYKKG